MIDRTNKWKHCPTCEGGIRRLCEWGCGRPCDHDDAPCPTCKKHFADLDLAVKKEREACARLAGSTGERDEKWGAFEFESPIAKSIARRIRARAKIGG